MGVVAAAAAAVTVVAGCSNDDESEGTGTDIGPISVDVSKVDDIAAGLPQKVGGSCLAAGRDIGPLACAGSRCRVG